MLSTEASLEHLLAQSLFYSVRMALRRIYVDELKVDPIIVLSHIPFSSAPLQADSTKSSLTYTPDRSVFRGPIYEDESLLDSESVALAVGEVKLIRGGVPNHELPFKNDDTVRRKDIGQLLWYCCQRKTRFAFCISNLELTIVQFTCNLTKISLEDTGRVNILDSLNQLVTRAGSEIPSSLGSSPPGGGNEGALGLPSSQQTGGGAEDKLAAAMATSTHKRAQSNASNSSTVSHSNHHFQKKLCADTSTIPESLRPSSSPDYPDYPLPIRHASPLSPVPPLDSSGTPENKTSTPSVYLPSTPYTANGRMSTNTIRELADVGDGFTARVFTLRLQNREADQAPLVILRLIALASLVEKAGGLRMSGEWVNMRNLLIDKENNK
jgi:hypothetical protein